MDFIKGKLQEIEDETINLSIESRCNNNCLFCMIGSFKKDMSCMSFEEFTTKIDEIAKSEKFKRLTLSGAEVTMNDNLESFVRYAKTKGKFKHIQIQTNGRKLSDPDFCKRLISFGVDEFFISFLGPKEIHNSLTGADSFDETVNGIRNLSMFDCEIIVNIVVTDKNYHFLEESVLFLSSFNVKSIWFWNYWPMSDIDIKGLVTDISKAVPHVISAIQLCESNKIFPVIRAFPLCLMQEYSDLNMPWNMVIITDRKYWERSRKNNWNCAHIKECILSQKGCRGVSEAYSRKFVGREVTFFPKSC